MRCCKLLGDNRIVTFVIIQLAQGVLLGRNYLLFCYCRSRYQDDY